MAAPSRRRASRGYRALSPRDSSNSHLASSHPPNSLPHGLLTQQHGLAQLEASTCATIVSLPRALFNLHPRLLRSLYGANVNQDLIQGIMTGMTSRRNTVDGVPTSLLDLGYVTVRVPWRRARAQRERGPPLTHHSLPLPKGRPRR